VTVAGSRSPIGDPARTQPFASILDPAGAAVDASATAPGYAADLHLDQVVAAVTVGRDEYELEPLYWRTLHDPQHIGYRHEVVRDLQQPDVMAVVRTFAERMREVRRRRTLARRLHFERQRERWLIEANGAYCAAVREVHGGLAASTIASAGLRGLQGWLAQYVDSDRFRALAEETAAILAELSEVHYTVHVRDARVRVAPVEDQSDLAAEVQATFARFAQGEVTDHRVRFRDAVELNHVEAQILDLVARLHPETFGRVRAYCERHAQAPDPIVVRFDREVQFYVAYLEHIAALEHRGLAFCLPDVAVGLKDIAVSAGFDLALAATLTGDDDRVVTNDLALSGPERIVVVTGPNQGGKTTFARMVGQLHHLAGLGLPVPAGRARLGLPDRVFTHFEREESLKTLRGKFEDELVRIREILDQATADSVLIMNESFGSTSLRDARLVGGAIVRRVIALDALCVFVTFVDELASLDPATVSLMSTVDPDDPARRTYEIVRRPADGLAHAAALARRHGLTYDALRERIRR